MFISLEQLRESIAVLNGVHPFFGIAFLGFKLARIPVGSRKAIIFSKVMEDVLQSYYRPAPKYPGFFSPFITSSPEQRWLSERYGSTSLQRIATDTFGKAFLHSKGESLWGWQRDYVQTLQKHLGKSKLPLFHLGVWLFREEELQDKVSRKDIVEAVEEQFNLTVAEIKAFCDTSTPQTPSDWLSPVQPTADDLYGIIGHPPGHRALGASLVSLTLAGVGPSKKLSYEPAERLNIITGDNSLGKTFLLDTIWWALTGNWYQYPALPPLRTSKSTPKIEFSTGLANRRNDAVAKFDWHSQQWTMQQERGALPGLVIYARHDGGFAVWDAYRAIASGGNENMFADDGAIKLSPAELWDGKLDEIGTAEVWLCNGLIRDWVSWQSSPRFANQYAALVGCLAELSPDPREPLRPSDPIRRLPLGAREVPTLAMPYGDVPLPLASAGIQRAVAIAYVMVWSWHEHLVFASETRREAQRQIVLLIDEVEAHLHPRWQRVIAPALMNVVGRIATDVTAQLHVATHSPMIMASLETHFSEEQDAVFHLEMNETRGTTDVTLNEIDFVRRGTIDRWLMHDLFGLEQARSREGETAIEDATRLQEAGSPDKADVALVHERLRTTLADDDPFWPRWLFFAQQHGVDE